MARERKVWPAVDDVMPAHLVVYDEQHWPGTPAESRRAWRHARLAWFHDRGLSRTLVDELRADLRARRGY